MSRAVVPVTQIERRLRVQGRIRIGGEKGAKQAGAKLDTFRFTSSEREAIEQIAKRYGGQAKPWANAPSGGQWQVFTETARIPIALPPDPLGGTPLYEMWAGSGCQRRCDGVDCTISKETDEGAELTEVPCICDRKGVLECKIKLRLSVVLRDIRPFSGVWRYDTSSWNTVRELPGMVDAIAALEQQGIQRGVLQMEERTGKVWDQRKRKMVTSKFNTVALGIDESIEALASGATRLGSLGPAAPDTPALASVTSLPVAPRDPDDDEAEDAEDPERDELIDEREVEHSNEDAIVEAHVVEVTPPPDEPAPAPRTGRPSPNPAQTKLVLDCLELAKRVGLDDETIRHALAHTVSDGRTSSSKDLTPEERSVALDALGRILTGEYRWRGIVDGWVKVERADD